jgi:hypothetical protein
VDVANKATAIYRNTGMLWLPRRSAPHLPNFAALCHLSLPVLIAESRCTPQARITRLLQSDQRSALARPDKWLSRGQRTLEAHCLDVIPFLAVRGGEKRSHFRRVKAVPGAPGGGAAGAGNSMGEDAVKDSIAVSIS